jgi:ribonuclease P protein component
MLPRARRLTYSRAFQALYRRGRRWDHPLVVLHVLPRPAGDLRFGVVVGKKIGGAVQRNRVRRRLREALRHHLPRIQGGAHGVLVARPAAADAAFGVIDSAVADLLSRARLLHAALPASGELATEPRRAGDRRLHGSAECPP